MLPKANEHFVQGPRDHVTNEEVRRKIQAATDDYDELLPLFMKQTLRIF